MANIPQAERWNTEAFGRYQRTVGPGFVFIVWPDKVPRGGKINIAQEALPLFQQEAWINLADGARAKPGDARALVRTYNPQTPYTVYKDGPKDGDVDPRRAHEVEDPSPGRNGCFRTAYNSTNTIGDTQELTENALRSYINSLTADDAVQGGATGYDLATVGTTGIPDDQLLDLRKALFRIGKELVRVTLSNLVLDDDTERQRQAQRRADSITREVIAEWINPRAVGGKTPDVVEAEVRADPTLGKELSDYVRQRVYDRMAAESGALRDYRVQGAGSLDTIIASILAGITGGRSGNP